jgi:hypothetical protein
MQKTIVVAVFLLAAASARAETIECTAITSMPFTIGAPGIYCLKQSFYDVPDGIVVKSDDVVIDLNGYVIDGKANGTGFGVLAFDAKNLTVRNGTISEFAQGVRLENGGSGSAGHIIEDLRLTWHRSAAVYVQGRGIIVRDNLVLGTGSIWNSAIGIWVDRGPGVHLLRNEIVDMTSPENKDSYATAIFVNGAPGSTIQHNVIRNTFNTPPSSAGIAVNSSDGTVIFGNRIFNMANGIRILGGTGLYRENTASGASTPFFGGTSGGANFSF